jgi:hypothetical protein
MDKKIKRVVSAGIIATVLLIVTFLIIDHKKVAQAGSDFSQGFWEGFHSVNAKKK